MKRRGTIRQIKGLKWKIYYLAVVLALPVLLAGAVFLVPAQYDQTYLGALADKRERLENAEGKKLIVVGGSSVPFGIRVDLMEEELEMTVADWGLYAPLGSRTMLEACFEEIREGDIVVFSPEQNPETLSFSFQAREAWQAMDGDFSLLGVFGETQWKALLGVLPEFAVSKVKYAVSGKPETDGIYQRDSFNEYGDISAADREENQMAEGYDAAQPIDFSYFPEEEFIQYLNEYAARVRRRGAEFYYRFCPMNELAVINEEKADEWFLRFDAETDFTILGNPHQCIMESGWFFDTNFHLNEAGAVVNTYYFVRDIKAELKDSSETKIKLPEMPKYLAKETGEGDTKDRKKNPTSDSEDHDGECFLYEEDGENLIITGVSEKGKDKKELTFPREYNGKKVSGVQPGSLGECGELEKVYVPGGMTLYDGCFGGCGTLREIILLGKPEEITAGRNLLQDSRALLYTKYEDDYRLDYSWSLYSDKIRKYNGS